MLFLSFDKNSIGPCNHPIHFLLTLYINIVTEEKKANNLTLICNHFQESLMRIFWYIDSLLD